MFSGIGGFPLAAYKAGFYFDNHYFSEIEKFPLELYSKRFPDSISLGDVTNIDFKELRQNERWIISGGFPCQPHSLAGKRLASKDERDLWSYCWDAVRFLRPDFAIFENVPGLFTSESGTFFERVLRDLASIGYNVEWKVISAAEVGAPHLRKRVWIVVYPQHNGSFEAKDRQSFGKDLTQRGFKLQQKKNDRKPQGGCEITSNGKLANSSEQRQQGSKQQGACNSKWDRKETPYISFH